VTAADVASQAISPGFDPVAIELWPFLHTGARIVIMPNAVRVSPDAVIAFIATHRITICLLSTALCEILKDVAFPPGCTLRYLLTGGDKLNRGPRIKQPFVMVDHYGPTEVSVATSTSHVPLAGDGQPNIGKPIDNYQARPDFKLGPVSALVHSLLRCTFSTSQWILYRLV
jgi:non-ribosomal peptide synthetase component F